MRVLYFGVPGGTSQQRAEALGELGLEIDRAFKRTPRGALKHLYRLGIKLRRPPDFTGSNGLILERVGQAPYDVLWIDKGTTIRPRTLTRLRASHPGTVIVSYSPDDMMNPDNHSMQYRRCVPLYHLHVTTKSYNVEELRQLGAAEVAFIDNAFDPATHRPLELSEEDRCKYAAEVGFVGAFERDRAEQMYRLARSGVPVRVWGPGWERFGREDPGLELTSVWLDGLEFAKAINATRVNLAFLRKVNRDLQTTRSIEIPACRAFMLAERTGEHSRLFVEGQEAEFFGSFEELLEKCRYYLEHEEDRQRVARAGWRRCVEGGYSNRERLQPVVERIAQIRSGLVG